MLYLLVIAFEDMFCNFLLILEWDLNSFLTLHFAFALALTQVLFNHNLQALEKLISVGRNTIFKLNLIADLYVEPLFDLLPEVRRVFILEYMSG